MNYNKLNMAQFLKMIPKKTRLKWQVYITPKSFSTAVSSNLTLYFQRSQRHLKLLEH